MTDQHGTFEHALFTEPRPEHGYCSDDMARVLIVMARERAPRSRHVGRFTGATGSPRCRRAISARAAAKYVTQTIDDTLVERKVTSVKDAQSQLFNVKEAGVYLVESEAYDRIGRRQQVSVDFFVGGQTPVCGPGRARRRRPRPSRPKRTPGRPAYPRGWTRQSPFQTARALAIVEEPGGAFRYDWVDIANGFGRYPFDARQGGNAEARGPFPASCAAAWPIQRRIHRRRLIRGKPVTIAATRWVTVTPVKNIRPTAANPSFALLVRHLFLQKIFSLSKLQDYT